MVLGMLLLALAVYGVTSYFRLSSEMAGLRDNLQTASGQEWRRTIALNIGGFTFGAARAGLGLVNLQEEARVALQMVRACEVGIYRAAEDAPTDRAAMLTAADEAMQRRGWERVVGVIKDDILVAVYMPAQPTAPSRMKCAVMVCEGRQMVLASARANLDPAINFALARADLGEARRLLARH
jgi:hypothetical protein